MRTLLCQIKQPLMLLCKTDKLNSWTIIIFNNFTMSYYIYCTTMCYCDELFWNILNKYKLGDRDADWKTTKFKHAKVVCEIMSKMADVCSEMSDGWVTSFTFFCQSLTAVLPSQVLYFHFLNNSIRWLIAPLRMKSQQEACGHFSTSPQIMGPTGFELRFFLWQKVS